MADAIFTFVLWSVLFVPGHLANWLVEWSLVLFLCALAPLSALTFKVPARLGPVKLSTVVGVCLFMELLYVIAFLRSQYVSHFETGLRDAVELPRYAIWGLLILLVSTVSRANKRKIFETTLKVSLIFAFTVFVSYAVDVPYLTEVFKEFLYSETKMRVVGRTWIRITAPFENPNFLAFYLLMALTYLLFFFTARPRALYVALASILIFLTGSRAGWLCSLVIVSVWVAFAISASREGSARKRYGRVASICLVMGVVAFGLLQERETILSFARVEKTFSMVADGSVLSDPSLANRIRNVATAASFVAQSPLIGLGTAKYATMDVVDNQFAKWALRSGILGLAIILSGFLVAFSYQYRTCWNRQHRYGVVAFWAAVIGMVQSGAFLDNYRLATIFLFFVAQISFAIQEGQSLKWDAHQAGRPSPSAS